MITPFALSGLLSGFSSLLFGTLVFCRSRDNRIGQVWFLFTFACALWGFGVFGISFVHDQSYATWMWRLVYAFAANWIAPLFYHFVTIFIEDKRQKPVLVQYGIGAIFFLMAFTPLQYAGVHWFHDAYYSTAGKLYLVSSIWWISLVLYSHFVLLRTYRGTTPLKKTQIKFFCFAMAFGFSGGVFDFLPPLKIDVYPWGNFTIFLYPLLMSYAILKHRLMDISLIIRKTLIYTAVMGILTVIYLAIVALFARIFQGITGYQTVFSSAVAACLITIGFQPLRKKVQLLVDAKFFRQYVDREEKLYELSREVITHTTPEAMGDALIHVIAEALHPKSSAIYLRSSTGTGFECISGRNLGNLPKQFETEHPLAVYFKDHPQPFLQDPNNDSGQSYSTREKDDREDAA